MPVQIEHIPFKRKVNIPEIASLIKETEDVGPGADDEFGTYILWDGNIDHPMKIGKSMSPHKRFLRHYKSVSDKMPDLKLVFVTPIDIESRLQILFEPMVHPGVKHDGWCEWFYHYMLFYFVERFSVKWYDNWYNTAVKDARKKYPGNPWEEYDWIRVSHKMCGKINDT